jgi:transcription factor C subunit 3
MNPMRLSANPSAIPNLPRTVNREPDISYSGWLPNSLEDILSKRMTKFTNAALPLSPEWLKFHSEVDAVNRWEERNLVQLHSGAAPGWRFINHTFDIHESANDAVFPNIFGNELRFKIYDDGQLLGETDTWLASELARQRKAAQEPKEAAPVRINIKRHKLTSYKKRYLTSRPPIDSLPQAQTLSNASFLAIGHRQRGPDTRCNLNAEESRKLLVAVVVVRILCGGLDKKIDWVIVASLFPGFTIAWLRKKWQTMQMKHRLTIEKLSTDFQEAYLDAYEAGELSPINYDNLVEHPWGKLVDWTIQVVLPSSE